MFRIGDLEPEALVIRGHAKSKERPFASHCPRSSTSGLSKRLPIGALSRKLSARCNVSAVRSSSRRCPIQNAASDSAKKSWDSFDRPSAQQGIPKLTGEIAHLRLRSLTTSKPRAYPGKSLTAVTKTSANYRQNVSNTIRRRVGASDAKPQRQRVPGTRLGLGSLLATLQTPRNLAAPSLLSTHFANLSLH